MAEMLYHPVQRGPRRYGGRDAQPAFMGLAEIPAGSASVVISTAAIKSDSLVLLGVGVATIGASGMGSAASSGGVICWGNVVHGTSFRVGWSAGAAPFASRISWEICQRAWKN